MTTPSDNRRLEEKLDKIKTQFQIRYNATTSEETTTYDVPLSKKAKQDVLKIITTEKKALVDKIRERIKASKELNLLKPNESK